MRTEAAVRMSLWVLGIVLFAAFDSYGQVTISQSVQNDTSPPLRDLVAAAAAPPTPDVLQVLRACAGQGLYINENETSFYLGRETLITGKGKGMAPWRKRLFRFLSRNARSATDFFSIPPNRVVEIGTQIELLALLG